jgi:hypothetical protein
MLIVNTSVEGAFAQLHHSPFLTQQITFADVPLFPMPFLTKYRQFSPHFSSAQDSQHPSQNRPSRNYVVEQYSWLLLAWSTTLSPHCYLIDPFDFPACFNELHFPPLLMLFNHFGPGCFLS